jgi:hypothetical protein
MRGMPSIRTVCWSCSLKDISISDGMRGMPSIRTVCWSCSLKDISISDGMRGMPSIRIVSKFSPSTVYWSCDLKDISMSDGMRGMPSIRTVSVVQSLYSMLVLFYCRFSMMAQDSIVAGLQHLFQFIKHAHCFCFSDPEASEPYMETFLLDICCVYK